MSARADTDLLWVRTRASSLSGVDCYRMSAAECERVIRDCEQRPTFPVGALERLRFNEQFDQVFGGGR